MSFSIIRNDITRVYADAIVNTANPRSVIGSGTDRAIYTAAGEKELLAERRKIGDILPGKAAATPAFALNAKYIIHTVGPAWACGDHGERETLRSCYTESLRLASELGCESIAFPLIATGVYGFPRDLAISTATSVIYDFLMHHEMMVYLVVFDSKAYDLSSKIFQDVQAYIDENYVSEKRDEEYNSGFSTAILNEREEIHHRRLMDARRRQAQADTKASGSAAQYISLSEHMKSAGKSFNKCLLEYMNKSGMSNSAIYRGANISKQTFSKIYSEETRIPKKPTICALALSMHLSLDETTELLGSAGYVLSKGSIFDLCIEYFVINKMYNIVTDNIILMEQDAEQLLPQ